MDVFKTLYVKLERQIRMKLKCIQTDNSGEYKNIFEEYYRNHGIRLKKAIPKTPQHNGVVKRMNRMICKRIRCMLSHAKLLSSFWREIMRTTVDLINFSLSVPLDGELP